MICTDCGAEFHDVSCQWCEIVAERDALRTKNKALESFLKKSQADVETLRHQLRAEGEKVANMADQVRAARAITSANDKVGREARDALEATLAYERVELARVRAMLAEALGDRAQPPVPVHTFRDEDFDA